MGRPTKPRQGQLFVNIIEQEDLVAELAERLAAAKATLAEMRRDYKAIRAGKASGRKRGADADARYLRIAKDFGNVLKGEWYGARADATRMVAARHGVSISTVARALRGRVTNKAAPSS